MCYRLIPRLDAGAILGVVESVVASIHEARGRSAEVISSEPMDSSSAEDQLRSVEANVASYRNGESEVVGDSNDMAPQDTTAAAVREDGDAEGVVFNNSKGSCWTRR